MIGRNRLYRNLKTIFGIARQPTKQCESWPVIWKPFVVEANRKQWGASLLLFGRATGHGGLRLGRFALKTFTIVFSSKKTTFLLC